MLSRGEDVNLWDMLYQRVLSTNPDTFHPQIPPPSDGGAPCFRLPSWPSLDNANINLILRLARVLEIHPPAPRKFVTPEQQRDWKLAATAAIRDRLAAVHTLCY
eukprot:5108524-Pleurochrysis_carterae.AAC.1